MALGSIVCAIGNFFLFFLFPPYSFCLFFSNFFFLEEKFQPYLVHFLPFIQRGLTMSQESSLIKNCVGLITDLAGVLRKDFAEYCPQIIELLLTNLKGEELDRNVKVRVLFIFIYFYHSSSSFFLL